MAPPGAGAVHHINRSHDLAQSSQGLFGFAPPSQDHEVVGIGHDARADASLQPEHLPSQHDDSRRPAGQQFGLPQATTGCVCTETTIAVPVPSASASKARIRVVTFMIFSPKADN